MVLGGFGFLVRLLSLPLPSGLIVSSPQPVSSLLTPLRRSAVQFLNESACL